MQDNFKEIINMSSSKSFSLSLNSFHSSEQLYQDFIKIFYLVRYEKFIGSACNIFKYLDKQMINTAYIFQAKTRLAVLQAALVHIVLYKRKVIVDQLRKRLELLGLLKEISRYPKFYKRFFVQTDRFSAAEMIAKIEFRMSDSQNQEERDIQSYIKTYISSSSSERLKEILVYSTGGYYLPNKKIKVVTSRRNNFFNSTCSFKIECLQFASYKEFETAFVGVINPEGKKFYVV